MKVKNTADVSINRTNHRGNEWFWKICIVLFLSLLIIHNQMSVRI
jgi:hypothetical protein